MHCLHSYSDSWSGPKSVPLIADIYSASTCDNTQPYSSMMLLARLFAKPMKGSSEAAELLSEAAVVVGKCTSKGSSWCASSGTTWRSVMRKVEGATSIVCVISTASMRATGGTTSVGTVMARGCISLMSQDITSAFNGSAQGLSIPIVKGCCGGVFADMSSRSIVSKKASSSRWFEGVAIVGAKMFCSVTGVGGCGVSYAETSLSLRGRPVARPYNLFWGHSSGSHYYISE